jgi:DNA-binding response OmpR family regulator
MRVAIADRDPKVSTFLKEVVEHMGHRASVFSSGLHILTQLQRDTFDLLILSWNLSNRSCPEVLNWIADNLTIPPAIMVITTVLHAGADDFMVIPENRDVLEARIAALLRRSVSRVALPLRPQQFGRYRFDRQSESVSIDDKVIILTSKEFALALLFFQNEQRALSRAYILDAVWNSVAGLPSRTLDMHVSRIRSKLQLKPEYGYGLLTVFGFGYRLERFED